jgi:hypothetical protein
MTNHIWVWGDDVEAEAKKSDESIQAISKSCYGQYSSAKNALCGYCPLIVGCMSEDKMMSERMKAMSEAKPKIEDTLKERGNRYGEFKSHALITQNIKSAMYVGGWHDLNSSQKEALEMIAHKIGRIINGDSNYSDSWHDIAGYAKLVEDQLNGK